MNKPHIDVMRYYKPMERPNRYPLELGECSITGKLHINLWSEDGRHKWTIALWHKSKDGCDLKFVGDRPLDGRVRWDHFRELVILGQQIADDRFDNERYGD